MHTEIEEDTFVRGITMINTYQNQREQDIYCNTPCIDSHSGLEFAYKEYMTTSWNNNEWQV